MSYQFEISHRPDYAMVTIQIPENEVLKVEASSMATMDTNIQMKTKLKGGFKRFLVKESLFINEFSPIAGSGEIKVAPGPSGDIAHYHVKEGESFYMTASSFLASASSVNQETKWQGMMKGLFSQQSFFLIRNVGHGDVWFNCYGAMMEIDVKGEYLVDTGHIVAFTENLDYQVSKAGGYKSLFFSGEGFVCRFQGEGKVWVQTKKSLGLVAWADAYRIVKKSNN